MRWGGEADFHGDRGREVLGRRTGRRRVARSRKGPDCSQNQNGEQRVAHFDFAAAERQQLLLCKACRKIEGEVEGHRRDIKDDAPRAHRLPDEK